MINLIQSHNIILVNITSRSDLWTLHRSRDKWRRDRNTCRPGLWRACASREPISWRDFWKILKPKLEILSLVPWTQVGSDLAWECVWNRRPTERGLLNGSTIDNYIKNTLSLHSNGVFYSINGCTHWGALFYLACIARHSHRPNHYPTCDQGTRETKLLNFVINFSKKKFV